ncbi:MAG: IPT/TIG domain-containing protein [Candidatus Paceibacterota bacterium]|jgi:hypothetical protein
MITKKNILIGAVAVMASASFSFAASVTAPQINIQGPLITVTPGAAITIVSPQGGVFTGNDTIPVVIEATNVVGPLYVYLFDPSLRLVVATEAFTNGQRTLNFNLSKSKAQASIAPGSYTIAVCDMGKKDSVCVQSRVLTITPEPFSLSSVDPITFYSSGSATISGTGFDSNSYVLVDGGWNSLVSLRATGNDTALLTVLPGLSYGMHTVQIANRGSYLAPSREMTIYILPLSVPTISSVTKSGDVYTVTGSGMGKSYPSKVEVIQNGRVIALINPGAVNTQAISSD